VKADIEKKLTIDELSDNANRIRRNLIIFSFVAIFYSLSGAVIEPEAGVNFNGLKFKGVDGIFIANSAFVIVLYHFIHFSAIAWAHFQYLRIRATKYEAKTYSTGDGILSDPPKGPDDCHPKDSSLVFWLSRNKGIIENLIQSKDEIKCRILNLKVSQDYPKEKLDSIIKLIEALNPDNIERIDRLTTSLKKFDKSFECYRRVELLRMRMIEIGLPLLLGVVAFCVLWSKIDFPFVSKICALISS